MLVGEIYEAGPSTAIVLPSVDFETYSEAGQHWDAEKQKWTMPPNAGGNEKGLSVVGVKNYVNHSSFEVLSAAYDLRAGGGRQLWVPSWGFNPQDLLDHVAAGKKISGWNAGGFEFVVWNDYCVPKFGWPPLKLEQLSCAMAKARSWALPGSLDNAGEVLNLQHKKDKDGKRLLRKFSVPKNPSKKDPRTRIRPEDDPVDGPKLYAYNLDDISAEGEAAIRTPDLSPDEFNVWLLDQRVNTRGLGVDEAGVEDCIAVLEQCEAKYNRELYTITGGAVESSTELAALQQWCATQGVNLPNMQAETIADALTWPHVILCKPVFRALEIRKMLGGAAVKKLYAFRYQSFKGRLYGLYSYWAARTGRWTGNGPQPQNLFKPIKQLEAFADVERVLELMKLRRLDYIEICYPGISPLDIIASCLRSLLWAKADHDLVCSDFSAIEGVVTAALAGCEWRLDVFRTHGMIYEASAAMICGLTFEDFVKHRTDSGGTATYGPDGKLVAIKGGKHHVQRNKIGKFAELASGFGGWVQAWKNFGADEHLTDQEIKQGILKWRAASPEIVELWGGQTRGRFDSARPELYGLEGAAIAAVKYPGQCFGYRQISYQMKGDVLYCRLPSGRLLAYHAPRLVPSRRFEWTPAWEVELSYEGWNSNPMQGPLGWCRMDLYGGKLTENVVQAVARDLQANAMLNVERAGYPVVLHSHDEIASEVPLGFGSVEDFESHANRLPSWACMPDGTPWPIRMRGGWRGRRYRKD
jgi:DNA polymerase